MGKLKKWKKARNIVQWQIKQAKKKYYANKIQNLKSKRPRQWWDYINNELGRSKTNRTEIKLYNVNGDYVAEVLNSFFAEAWTSNKMCATFPLANPTKMHELCSIGQIKQALIRLDTRKASGPDEIPPWLLKNHAEDLAPVKAHLINTSYQVGILPTAWKEANICPVPKVAQPNEKSDWRPISLHW